MSKHFVVRNSKVVIGDDNKIRRWGFDKEKGVIFYIGYAKDFQEIIELKKPTAQEIIDEIQLKSESGRKS